MVNDKKIYDTFARNVSQYVVKIAFLHLDHLALLCYPRPGVTLGFKRGLVFAASTTFISKLSSWIEIFIPFACQPTISEVSVTSSL